MMSISQSLLIPTGIFIPTPMYKLLHDTIQSWLWYGFQGGLVIGESRVGKSRAIRELSDSIKSRTNQDVPIHRMVFGERDNKTIREAWIKIAKSTSVSPIRPRATSEDLSSQVAFYLAESALINDSSQVILIADEIQFLTINQLSVFAELNNMLTDAGINSLMVFIANKEVFGDMATELVEPANRYIRQRFFNNVHEFIGIQNENELEDCLAYFDETGDGVDSSSFIENLVPGAYEKGFRLSQIAEITWRIYCDTYKEFSISQSWGMEYFSRFIKILLLDYLPKYDVFDDDKLKAMIANSLKASGFEPMLRNYFGRKK